MHFLRHLGNLYRCNNFSACRCCCQPTWKVPRSMHPTPIHVIFNSRAGPPRCCSVTAAQCQCARVHSPGCLCASPEEHAKTVGAQVRRSLRPALNPCLPCWIAFMHCFGSFGILHKHLYGYACDQGSSHVTAGAKQHGPDVQQQWEGGSSGCNCRSAGCVGVRASGGLPGRVPEGWQVRPCAGYKEGWQAQLDSCRH